MVRLRFSHLLALGSVLAVVAGCGSKPARVLAPSPKTNTPARAEVGAGGIAGVPLVPPTVRITCPVPSPLTAHVTLTALQVLWDGTDPDGVFTNRPVKYKHILLGPGSEFPVSLALADPDALRRYYVDHPAGAWAGWDSTGGDTTRTQLSNLIPGAEYVFAVVAFDESGLYSPLFSLSTNLLHLEVSYDGYAGPRLTVSGPGFEHEFAGYDPSHEVVVQVEEGQSVSFEWFVEPGGSCGGVGARAYRWTLDIADLFDETPRTDEETDLDHWSAPSLAKASATVGPFQLASPPATEEHRFYVQAEDVVGVRSLGTVRITVVPATNRPPDCGGAGVLLAAAWPPDGSFAAVSVTGVTDPDGDPVTITVTGVTQDEPVDDVGDGSTCPDAMIVDGAAQVRRERSGTGNGRVYSISFTADDGQGGRCTGVVDACIPHDRGRGRPCVKDDLSVSSLGGCADAVRRGPRGRITQLPGDPGR